MRWYQGQEKLGNYTSKHHLAHHHMQIHPIYLHMKKSQQLLPSVIKPRYLGGCVGKAAGGYIWGRPSF